MKNFISSFAAAAALLFPLTLSLSSCSGRASMDAPNTHNPPERALNGTGFGLVALDGERGFSKDSNYVFEGEWRDGHFWFGREKLDTMQLNITPTNSIVLKISSEDPAFEGVNAASSSRCIDIVPDAGDRSSFHLEWVEEGQSRITLWCGEGPARHEISFIATSRKEIPMTGIKVRIDGVEGEMAVTHPNEVNDNGESIHYIFYGKPAIAKLGLKLYSTLVQEYNSGYDRNDISRHVIFEIAGPIPLNATPTEKIYTAFDAIGIIENGVFGDPGKLSPSTAYWIYGLYLENLKHNPDFRWFNPVSLESDDIGLSLLRHYKETDLYTLYPADLRERCCWVWPQTNSLPNAGDAISVAFYQGDYTVIEDSGGYYIRMDAVLFQKLFVFNNLKNWWYYGE
ncbi:MAG: hypothetical protein IJU34_05240 [Bacteroidales bacterium]|nr:hypothetical protein [Bacteroidales bacterium]